MTLTDVLVYFAARVAVLSLPLFIGALALRRLFLSRTSNIVIYALTVGYCAFTVAALIPWAMGVGPASATFTLSALFCPPIWGMILFATAGQRRGAYAIAPQGPADALPDPLPVLVLTDPLAPPDTPIPVFRHHQPTAPVATKKNLTTLSVARSMRGRRTSEPRRIRKLLPPPVPTPVDLPFVR